ncbi:MAG TPA: hypothetical protein VKY24_20210 [Reyranella sp.]|nr:hypothetical protein [Reyranella sp.]
MTRAQTLIVTTALAAAFPLASAMAQAGGSPGTKCGAETWSTSEMKYVSVPCVGAEAVQQGSVGQTTPSAAATNSTTYTKAQMKQGEYYTQPMQTQAVAAGPSYTSMGSASCGPKNAVAITDEYGHKYNCRGDRIR